MEITDAAGLIVTSPATAAAVALRVTTTDFLSAATTMLSTEIFVVDSFVIVQFVFVAASSRNVALLIATTTAQVVPVVAPTAIACFVPVRVTVWNGVIGRNEIPFRAEIAAAAGTTGSFARATNP